MTELDPTMAVVFNIDLKTFYLKDISGYFEICTREGDLVYEVD
jgi:hypothetical protein